MWTRLGEAALARLADTFVLDGFPSNLLAEGLMSVQAVLMSIDPEAGHAVVDDAVAFRVLDDLNATDTARGRLCQSDAWPDAPPPALDNADSSLPQNSSNGSAGR